MKNERISHKNSWNCLICFGFWCWFSFDLVRVDLCAIAILRSSRTKLFHTRCCCARSVWWFNWNPNQHDLSKYISKFLEKKNPAKILWISHFRNSSEKTYESWKQQKQVANDYTTPFDARMILRNQWDFHIHRHLRSMFWVSVDLIAQTCTRSAWEYLKWNEKMCFFSWACLHSFKSYKKLNVNEWIYYNEWKSHEHMHRTLDSFWFSCTVRV